MNLHGKNHNQGTTKPSLYTDIQRKGSRNEKENYSLSFLISVKTDSTALAFCCAFSTAFSSSSSYLTRTKSIPSAINAFMGIPVSDLISLSNSYFSDRTLTLVFTSLSLAGIVNSPYENKKDNYSSFISSSYLSLRMCLFLWIKRLTDSFQALFIGSLENLSLAIDLNNCKSAVYTVAEVLVSRGIFSVASSLLSIKTPHLMNANYSSLSFSSPSKRYPTNKSLILTPLVMALILSWSRKSSSNLMLICTIAIKNLDLIKYFIYFFSFFILEITFSIIALRSFTSSRASFALSRIRRSIDSTIKSWIDVPVAFLISSRTLYFSTGTLILVDTVLVFSIKPHYFYFNNKFYFILLFFNLIIYKNLDKNKNKKTNYFLSFWKLAIKDLIISAFCPAVSAAFCKMPSLAARTNGTPSLTRDLIDLPVSSLIILNKLYSSGGISTVTLVETNFFIRTPRQNQKVNYSFFFSTVTIATHFPSILSNSQIRLSPSFKSKWSLNGAGTVVLKLLAWFAFVNFVLKPDIKFSYYYYLFKYLFSYLIRYLYIILGNTIGNDDYHSSGSTNESISKMEDLMKTININHIFSSQIFDYIFQIFKTYLKRLFLKKNVYSYYILYIILIDLSLYLSTYKDYIRDNVTISSIFSKLMTLSPGGLRG